MSKGLRQLEINRDQGLGFNRSAVNQIRLVAPLTDGAIRSLSQKERAADQLEVLDGAVASNKRLQYDCALQACTNCLFRIAGQNLLQQKFAGEIFRQFHWLECSQQRRCN